ncbi:MFS transporter [Sandaracinobacteroides saxicola]|uniref:MFS transporter n=1 Tax=Sandaracinobacteroides saxicola TaxID=2759707 RepID=A0A7G5II16_9SPHN|nr:MFS transporter [Sandaracinobacteroides saxicola]QMW23008.1 MFS transporter [Sandaracinobacteroides saxicola]
MSVTGGAHSQLTDSSPLSSTRWAILALVVVATIINNFDRQMIALLKPFIEAEFGWGDTLYARLAFWFQIGAAVSYLFAGWFVDRAGVRIGYAVGVGVWSFFTLLHAFVQSFAGMVGLRIALGGSESVNTPAAIKAVATYFPPRESSLAMGIANSASNIGAIITPLAIPAMAIAFGWRNAFIVTAVAGFVWLVVWLLVRPAAPSLAGVVPTPEASLVHEPADRWFDLLRDRRVAGFALAKALTDSVWWLMMFWAPDFFMRTFSLTVSEVALPVAGVYVLAALGSVSGGMLAQRLILRGMPVKDARLRVLFTYGTLALVAPIALFTAQLWVSVLMVGLVLFAHQGFSTNLFATVIDAFPARRVASVVALGALAGNVAGAVVQLLVGWLLETGIGYLPLFVAAGLAYLLGALAIRALTLRAGD